MTEKISGCIFALRAMLKNCNDVKEDRNINPFRLQAFDILNELLSELPVVEDYVFTKFHEEFEEVFTEIVNGRWSNNMFTPPVRNVFGKCVEQIYAVHGASALPLIRNCLKYLNSRYCSLVKIQCMEILSILMDAKNKDISIFMGDCITFCSKFNRATDTEEKIAYLHFLGSIFHNFLLVSDSSIFANTVPTIYKQLQKLMRIETCLNRRIKI